MPFIIRVETQEDVDFLQSLFDNAITKLKRGESKIADATENILRLHECVHAAVPLKDKELLGVTDELGTEEKAAQKQTREKFDFCSEHPTYGAARPPRKDCKTCWSAYKKFHPLDYTQARRKFIKQNEL